MYGRLNIDAKFQKCFDENQGKTNIEELMKEQVKTLHSDWDKTNALVRDTYPEVSLPDEVQELGVVKFINDGELVYVNWPLLKENIDYLRTFNPLGGDMDNIIESVLNNI